MGIDTVNWGLPSRAQPDSAKPLSITAWDTNYLCPSPPWSAKAASRLNIISAWTAQWEMAAPTGTGKHEGRECFALLPLPEVFISTVVL